LSRSIDPALVNAFGRNDAEPFRWFRPFRAIVSAAYRLIKYRSEEDDIERLPKLEPTDYDIAASPSDALKDYGEPTYVTQ
jgi:hypothetical protein